MDKDKGIKLDGQETPSDEALLALLLAGAGKSPSQRLMRVVERLMKEVNLRELTSELASPVGLLATYGLTQREIAQLTTAYTFIQRCFVASTLLPLERHPHLHSDVEIARILQPKMMHLPHEEMHLLVLNSKNQVVGYHILYKGTVNEMPIRVAEVLRPAIVRNCPRLVLGHNHPSGDPHPSPEDITLTLQVAEAAKMHHLELLDHIIIGNPRYVSLREKLHWA